MSDFRLELQREIEPHLKRIERILQGRYTLTLFARYSGAKPLDDADILLSMDDLGVAVSGIERLARREPTITPDRPSPQDSPQAK